MFQIDPAALQRIAAIGAYPLDDAPCVLFALRGAVPVVAQDFTPGPSKPVELAAVDHVHCRCTLGIWDRVAKTVAVFPGSTVPHRTKIDAALKGGSKVNEVMPGLLAYRKGKHKQSVPDRQMDAFVQGAPFPFRRTADDLDFDADDPIEIGHVGDNIHCAFNDGPGAERFDSQGCLVVCGFARRTNDPVSSDKGAWPRFRDLAYATGQESYSLLLAPADEAQAAASAAPAIVPLRLRFGSRGQAVEALQRALIARSLLPAGSDDGEYGQSTVRAVAAAQRAAQLPSDGMCAIHTADALGLGAAWPKA